MLSFRTLSVIALAALCGVFTAMGVNKLRTPVTATPAEPQTTPVVVAAADIDFGQRIVPEDLEIRPWPVDLVPADAMATLEEATGTDERPHWASSKLVRGEFLSKAKVTTIRGLQVRPGYRAYTIQCSTDAANVAGFVLPGNSVDVLCARKGSREMKADTLVSGVRVLAVGQQLEPPADHKNENVRSVTLEVSLEQAEVLAQGQSGGQLTLALRNPDEPDEPKPPMPGDPSPPTPGIPKEQPRPRKIIRTLPGHREIWID